MSSKRRKGTIVYLFEIADVNKKSWNFSLAISVLGILFEAVPFISVYYITRHVLKNYQTPYLFDNGVFLFWGIFAMLALVLSVVCTMLGGYAAHKSAF